MTIRLEKYYLLVLDERDGANDEIREFSEFKDAFITLMALKIAKEKYKVENLKRKYFKLYGLTFKGGNETLILIHHSSKMNWKKAYEWKRDIEAKVVALKL